MADQRSAVWFPYTQMQTASPPIQIVRAQGSRLMTDRGEWLIDATASWWCVIHGYNHPVLNQAIHDQCDRMAHVMLGGLTHEPAEHLAKKLVAITPDGLNHVFFVDSGSVGVEVAIKIAIQYFRHAGLEHKTQLVGLRGGYHGDTTGAMSVSDPVDSMHHLFSGVLLRHHFVSPPRGFYAGSSTVDEYVDELSGLLRRHHHHIAAVIIEPILQAAGGFSIMPPAYLDAVRLLCDQYHVLLIFDEVATGFGRVGRLFATHYCQASPDIMVIGKAMTGGYIGHGATLCCDRVYDRFLSDRDDHALMHGPTFMGNPLACAVGLASIQLCETTDVIQKSQRIESILTHELGQIKSGNVRDIRIIGATGVVEMMSVDDVIGFQDFARQLGVWMRPFGPFIYTMPPLSILPDELVQITHAIGQWCQCRR